MKIEEKIEQYLNEVRDFNWKGKGKSGTFIVKLRFSDEFKGESFFDTTFESFGSKPGLLQLRGIVKGGSTKDIPKNLISQLKNIESGTKMTLEIAWFGPSGEKPVRRLPIEVENVNIDGSKVQIQYSPASKSKK